MLEKPRRRRHSEEFKREVVKRMRECKNILGLGRELGLDVKMMYQWKWKQEGRPPAEAAGADDAGGERDGPGGFAAGERAVEAGVGGEGAGAGFFQRCLAASRRLDARIRAIWRDAVYGFIGKADGVRARRIECRADVSTGGSEPGGLLPEVQGESAGGRGDGGACGGAADRAWNTGGGTAIGG